MNFQTILEELDKLYVEEVKTGDVEEETAEDVAVAENPEDKVLNEAVEDEEILINDEPIIDDETPEAEATEDVEDNETEASDMQVVLECTNCGALTLSLNTEIRSEEDGLVNVEETCQYCEEAKGYKILGNLVPAEAVEEVAEEAEEDEAPLD